MTAYATGGLTPELPEEPEAWPDGWVWPPTEVDHTVDPPLWIWPPGWPPVWFDTAYTKVLTCATTDILFVNTSAPATSPDTAVVSYSVDVTAVGGGAYTDAALNNHRMAVWIADADGNTISEVDEFAIAVANPAGVTQMTGSVTATVTTDMASVTLKAQIVSLQDVAVTKTLTISTVDLDLSVSSACNGGTLESSVGVVNNDGTWGVPTVTTANVVEE